jgi:hypothetical protein
MYEMFSSSNLIQNFYPTKAFAQNFVKANCGVGMAVFGDKRGEGREEGGGRREA